MSSERYQDWLRIRGEWRRQTAEVNLGADEPRGPRVSGKEREVAERVARYRARAPEREAGRPPQPPPPHLAEWADEGATRRLLITVAVVITAPIWLGVLIVLLSLVVSLFVDLRGT